jgi:hypothetical protein
VEGEDPRNSGGAAKARREGTRAAFEHPLFLKSTKHPECPYEKGSILRQKWFDGFYEEQINQNVGHILRAYKL